MAKGERSKYLHTKERIAELKKENPKFGSDAIAEIIKKEFNLDLTVATFGRMIRKFRWLGNTNSPQSKVLIMDIETAPALAFIWGLYPKAIPHRMIHKDWFMFSWSGKWLFENELMSYALTPSEAKKGNDKRIVKALWQAMDKADIVIAHNLKKFDRRKANTRFLAHNLNLPSHYDQIDTLVHLRKQFSLLSNRLDYVSKHFFDFDGKIDTNFDLWRGCYFGDQDSLTKMREYCDKDVIELESVYLELRPYIQPHPNIGLFEDGSELMCPSCGSHALNPAGEYTTYVNVFQEYRCGDCGALSRARKNKTPKEVRERLLVSTPR